MNILYKKVVCLLLYQICFWKRNNAKSLLVLTYHRITDQPDFQDPLKVSLATFEKQIIFLKKYYTIISGDQLADIIRNNMSIPAKSCLLTFDDGWRDNYTNAYPVLMKYKVPALIFISTDYIGTNKVFWHEQLVKILLQTPSNVDIGKCKLILDEWPSFVSKRIEIIIKNSIHKRRVIVNELIEYLKTFDLETIDKLIQELKIIMNYKENKKPLMLSWKQAKEMSMNNIGFGSHTKSHAILTQISERKVLEELKESSNIIENKIDKPVCFFAYPNGNYNELIMRIVEKFGFVASFTCLPGINYSYKNRFELKRKNILEKFSLGLDGDFSELFFKVDLSGIRDYLKRWRYNIKY